MLDGDLGKPADEQDSPCAPLRCGGIPDLCMYPLDSKELLWTLQAVYHAVQCVHGEKKAERKETGERLS